MMKGAWCLVRGAWIESVKICVYPWLVFSNAFKPRMRHG
jgi:hypothetical protein